MEPKSKFKSVLQERIDRDYDRETKEAELRKEYGIEEGRSVGIKLHKDSFVVGMWSILKDVIRSIAAIIFLLLAAVGFISLMLPETRELIIQVGLETIVQIKTFLPM